MYFKTLTSLKNLETGIPLLCRICKVWLESRPLAQALLAAFTWVVALASPPFSEARVFSSLHGMIVVLWDYCEGASRVLDAQ